MKKLIYITTFISLILSFSACENDLNNRILPEDEQLMNTERSAFYAMIGILQLVQQAGDNAVLLGELRGDLMDVTQNSSQDMRDIVEFKADSANEYIQPQKFYAIINNCNLLINKIDTSLIISGTKVLQKEMKVAKTFRAWAYMQLMQQYGKVYYYAEPMLSVSDRNNYLVIDNMTQLTDSLIPDLLPFCPTDGLAESYPDYKSIGSFASQNLFIPTRFMLGEMYLWRNEYTLAANIYYQLIYTEKLVVLNFNNTWNSTQTGYITQWPNLFSNLAVKEQLAYIGYTSEYANNTTLSTLASATVYKIAPSAVAVNNWESQTYSITNAQTLSGDLRGRNGSYANFSKLNELNDREDFVRINKYSYMTDYTTLCRTSLV